MTARLRSASQASIRARPIVDSDGSRWCDKGHKLTSDNLAGRQCRVCKNTNARMNRAKRIAVARHEKQACR